MKNTKPNRDITAEILKGVILPEGITQDEVDRVVNYFTTIGIIEDIIDQRLTTQRESLDAEHIADKRKMVKELRMEKKSNNPIFAVFLGSGETWGYNQAIDEFNKKLDSLI